MKLKFVLLSCLSTASTVLIPRDQNVLVSTNDVSAKDNNKPCIYLDETSHYIYDLNKLTKTDGDYKIEILESKTNKKKTFNLNVCHALVSSTKGLKDPTNVAISVEEGDKVKSLGKTNSTLTMVNNNIILSHEDGDNCPGIDIRRRKTKIVFECDKSISNNGSPVFIDDFESCHYIFEWKTPLVCSSNGSASDDTSSSGWIIFFKVISVLGLIYLFAGILYNRFAKGAQGLEQLPHFDFWFKIFDFVKDMSLIIALKAWDSLMSFKTKVSSRYQSVPRNDGHILVEDDEDDF